MAEECEQGCGNTPKNDTAGWKLWLTRISATNAQRASLRLPSTSLCPLQCPLPHTAWLSQIGSWHAPKCTTASASPEPEPQAPVLPLGALTPMTWHPPRCGFLPHSPGPRSPHPRRLAARVDSFHQGTSPQHPELLVLEAFPTPVGIPHDYTVTADSFPTNRA